MNAQRRAAIKKLVAILDDILGEIDTLKDEEQEYYDNMLENLQSSERGETAQAAANSLENASSSLQEAIQSAEEAQG